MTESIVESTYTTSCNDKIAKDDFVTYRCGAGVLRDRFLPQLIYYTTVMPKNKEGSGLFGNPFFNSVPDWWLISIEKGKNKDNQIFRGF
ncbi:hypothetical protein [Candidatus Aquicultor sp.]